MTDRAMDPINPARRSGAAVVVATALGLLACAPSDILKVQNPDVIPPDDVSTPQGLAALHAGAIGDFAVAYGGDAVTTAVEGQILVSGSFADELGNSETFPTRKEYDQRAIDTKNGTLDAVMRNLQNARRSAEHAGATIQTLSTAPTTDSRIVESYSLAGFAYIFMGENYCSGVPISDFDGTGALNFGPPLTTTALLTKAIEKFDAALQVQGSEATRNLAKIGRGRALLDLGRFPEAATAVAGVPTTFAYNTTHSTSLGRQQNGVFVFISQNERFSVANLDGGNGLDFRAAQDPRVPWARTPATNVGFDNATPIYYQGKYASETASIPVATGVEGQLIAAEVALKNADVTGWLGILNTLRATTSLYPSVFPAGFPAQFPALTPLADPGNDAARLDLMFRERAFWLYLTSHRLGDLRRLVRQYGRSASAVFPGGGGAPYVIDGNNKGGIFGTEMNLPVPFSETNNPQFTECLDRNP